MFVISVGHSHAEFRRALENGHLWVAEALARDLPQILLEDAYKLRLHVRREGVAEVREGRYALARALPR